MSLTPRRDVISIWGQDGAVSVVPGHLVLSLYDMAFTDTVGGIEAPTQFVQVTTTQGAITGVTTSIAYGSGSGWLTATVIQNVDAVVAVSTTTGALSPGTYTATISVMDAGADNSPQYLRVTFTVNAAPQSPIINPSQSSFTFTGTAGDTTPTATQTLTVSNAGGGAFGGLAAGNVVYGPGGTGWLTGSISGNTVSGYANAGSLAAGNYTATFDITDSLASNSPVTIGVNFAVSAVANPTMSFTSTQPNFSALVGGSNPSNQTITITDSSGTGTLAGPVVGSITYGSGSGWLTTASLATVVAGSTYTLTVGCTVGALTAGTYTASFPVTDASATNSPVTVSVTFVLTTVTPPGNFPAPLYPLMQSDIPATFDATNNTISWNPFTYNPTANPEGDPEGDPNHASYYYAAAVGGARDLTATTLTQLNTHCATAAADPTNIYIIRIGANISTSSNWTLPAKAANSKWTLITNAPGHLCSALEADRPTAANFSGCYKITFTGAAAYRVRFAAGSDGWHFRDLYFENGSSTEQFGLFKWGVEPDATTIANAPERLKFERVYLNNPYNNSNRYVARGLYLCGRYAIVRRNRIEGMCKNGLADSQGIYMLNCLGDIQIEDNFVEGASENINLGGGAVSMGVQNYCHNIHIRGNHLYKRPDWLTNTTGSTGGSTVYSQIKNFFEMKHGRYVVFEDNYCENHNGQGQQCDIVLKVSPYASAEVNYLRTQDITIRNNYGTNSCGGAFELSCGDLHPGATQALPTERIEIRNNAFVSPRSNGTNNIKRHIIGGYADATHKLLNMVFNHNWFSLNEQFALLTPAAVICIPGLVYTNNINGWAINYQAIASSGAGTNIPALNAYCGNGTGSTTWTLAKNVAVHAAGAADIYGGLQSTPYNNINYTSIGTLGSGTVSDGTLYGQLNSDPNDRSPKTTSTALFHTATDYTAANGLSIGPDWTQLVRALAANT